MSKPQSGGADEYVGVYSAGGMPEANLVRSVLEGAGIPVLLLGESAGTAIGLTVGTLAFVEVWVPREREAEAQMILAGLWSPTSGDETPGEFLAE